MNNFSRGFVLRRSQATALGRSQQTQASGYFICFEARLLTILTIGLLGPFT